MTAILLGSAGRGGTGASVTGFSSNKRDCNSISATVSGAALFSAATFDFL
jgi:hypothetical protein